jgi:hypothetical protein
MTQVSSAGSESRYQSHISISNSQPIVSLLILVLRISHRHPYGSIVQFGGGGGENRCGSGPGIVRVNDQRVVVVIGRWSTRGVPSHRVYGDNPDVGYVGKADEYVRDSVK